MSDRRAEQEPQAFVLHAAPYRETSLLLEVFCRGRGRMSMVARGARRPRSAQRAVLMEFQPVALQWFGKGEVRTMTRAEWLGGAPPIRGEALMCGYYLNELVVRLLPREDAHEALFDAYRQTLQELAAARDPSPALRKFEKALLSELGYALSLDKDSTTGLRLEPDTRYHYQPERGPVPASPPTGGASSSELEAYRGKTLLDIAADDFSDPQTALEAKFLMRSLINRQLEYRPLNCRRVYSELMDI